MTSVPPPPPYTTTDQGNSGYVNYYGQPGSVSAGYAPVSYTQASGQPGLSPTKTTGCQLHTVNQQPDGPLPPLFQNAARAWFWVAVFVAVFLFFPLGIPGALFAHKAQKDAATGDKMGYVKNMRISRILTGLGMGFGISLIVNLAIRAQNILESLGH